MKNNSYKLLIFDDHYSIVSDEAPDKLTRAATMVDVLMREISSKISHIDEKRVAVLVALQMANKVLSLEAQVQDAVQAHEKLIELVEKECIMLLRQ